METNGLPGGMFSGIGSAGMLGLEIPLHPPPPKQSPQNPHQLHLHHPQPQPQPQPPQMVAASYCHHETDQSQHQHQSVKQGYPFGSRSKQQQPSPLSDEDEPSFTPDDGGGGDAKRKNSPWQRMKWTGYMVRLLIMAVYYIGDEGGSEGNNDPSGKKKVGGGLLQKKGKWKSVSRAMMEKGFCVSPQQCEDKFNDLNKRYKRVNDILGRGTACRVVENQSLLDTMDLPPKLKEEARKLLNSKHLFFREMCAYHSSCGHGAGASGANHSPEVATETSLIQHQQQVQVQQQQQQCLHSSDNNSHQIAGNSGRIESEAASKLGKLGTDEEDDEDDNSESDDDSDEEAMDGHSMGQNGHGQDQEDDEVNDEKSMGKRPRKGGAFAMPLSQSMQQLSCEVMNVIQDGSKKGWEKKHWIKIRLMQLEEQQVSYRNQAYKLEKQRLKWVKFSGKKEREMERAKLENEKRRLENERMVLLVRQKELELIDVQQQHSSNKRGDPSSITC